MKKRLLFGLSIFTFLGANAQQNIPYMPSQSALVSRSENYVKHKVDNNIVAKAQGDTIWENDFSTPADWVIGTLPGHTTGDWQIVSAMPTSLTSQVPPYSFPTAMLSTSGGNFALINSDAAGATGHQRATITVANGIDLSTYGSSAISVRFKNIFRHYYDTNYVDVSNDGGTTWVQYQVNAAPEVPVNSDSGNPGVVTLNITSAIGAGTWSNNVKIRFNYNGDYDWFWGIDDVQLIETFDNDMKLLSLYSVTDTSTTLGVDYHFVPVSQASFPGLTFQAKVLNNGAATQNNCALNASSGAYNSTGASIVVAPGANDSVRVSTPFPLPTAVGNYTVDVTTDLGTPDANPADNEKAVVIRRDQNLFGCDNDIITGSIGNVSSQPDLPLKIGNLMEIFDPIDVTTIKIRLVNQPTAVGQTVSGEIYVFNQTASAWEFYRETVSHTIVASDVNTFVTLPMSGGAASLAAGDIILLLAAHQGGTDEVRFGMAQDVVDGSVRGITAGNDPANDMFRLLEPSAIMIRMSDKDELGVGEKGNLIGLSVYPNPATDVAKVKFDAQTQSNVVINVTDMTGKVALSNTLSNVSGVQTVELNTSELNAGIYLVNVTVNGVKSTKKLTIK